jgi:hypothetical protein
MEREEAIEELKSLKENYFDEWLSPRQYDDKMLAFDMAIKALEKEHIPEGDKKMNSESYQALVTHYFNLQQERKACLEQINVIEAVYKAIDEEMAKINEILCKYGNHVYEHFEEEQTTTARSEETESELINCESTKCDNCVNHNDCEYEPYSAESER